MESFYELSLNYVALFYESGRCSYVSLKVLTEDEILNSIEKSNKTEAYNSDECSNEIYKVFVDEYNKCESIIPI